jgi:CheY-like chemotaxis protein
MSDDRKLVFIVDDDPDNREMFGSYLAKRGGYSVEDFGSGHELFERLRTAPVPDAILLDLVLPDDDGCDIYEKILENDSSPNTIIMSLSGRGRQATADYWLGYLDFDDSLAKPADPALVVARVDRAFQERAAYLGRRLTFRNLLGAIGRARNLAASVEALRALLKKALPEAAVSEGASGQLDITLASPVFVQAVVAHAELRNLGRRIEESHEARLSLTLRIHDSVSRIISAQKGRLISFSGRELTWVHLCEVKGRLRAAQNDCLEAVQRIFKTLSESGPPDERVELSVGIASGRCLFGVFESYTSASCEVVGSAVEAARDTCRMALPGQTVVTRAVANASKWETTRFKPQSGHPERKAYRDLRCIVYPRSDSR